MCCNKGRVDIYTVPTPPPTLQRLFAKQDPLSSEFLKNIREYNAEFQMASSTANFEKFTSGVSQVCAHVCGYVGVWVSMFSPGAPLS